MGLRHSIVGQLPTTNYQLPTTNYQLPPGVTLSLGGSNDLVVQMINPYWSATGVSAGWTDTDFPSNYFGVADELSAASGAPPTWTTSGGGHATGSALAFNLGSSSGGGYTLAVGPTTVGSGVLGGAITQAIYYVPNIEGGANTVTVTFNQSASYADIRVLEYSGLDTTNPLDVVAAGTGNSTSSNSGSATTSSANELIFGANTVYTGTNAAGSGFTLRIITHDGDIAEDENVSSTGSYSASATLSSGGNWVMQMATFKAATTSGTSVYADVAYAPFGEAYAPSGASDLSFTGQNQDMASNLFDFPMREYHSSQGRWISPDPAGLAAANPVNPQTWNRYAYVGGNPLSETDPTGLCGNPGQACEGHWNTFDALGSQGGDCFGDPNCSTYEINGMPVASAAFNGLILGQGGAGLEFAFDSHNGISPPTANSAGALGSWQYVSGYVGQEGNTIYTGNGNWVFDPATSIPLIGAVLPPGMNGPLQAAKQATQGFPKVSPDPQPIPGNWNPPSKLEDFLDEASQQVKKLLDMFPGFPPGTGFSIFVTGNPCVTDPNAMRSCVGAGGRF